jgi:hypothetical protein
MFCKLLVVAYKEKKGKWELLQSGVERCLYRQAGGERSMHSMDYVMGYVTLLEGSRGI